MKKTAVIIYNLGGPCCTSNIKPFLFNLFYDPYIISLPNPFRYGLAKLISSSRESKASAIYAYMGGKSPILEQTYAQSAALEKALSVHGEYKVFVYMRYTYPFIQDVFEQLELFKPDHVILLPLYPQYSTTTTESSINLWKDKSKKEGVNTKTSYIESYETHPSFIKSYSDLLKNIIPDAKKLAKPLVLFSAHGIPLIKVKKGDPYQKHVELSVNAVMQEIGDESLEYKVCYQSKVGPMEWLGPPTDTCIVEAAKAGRSIIIVPISFVSEHSETLVELDIQYKELAMENGAKGYFRVPACGIDASYIECLKQITLEHSS